MRVAKFVAGARYGSTVTPGSLDSKLLAISLQGVRDVYHTSLASFFAPSYSSRSRSAPRYFARSAAVCGRELWPHAFPARVAETKRAVTRVFTLLLKKHEGHSLSGETLPPLFSPPRRGRCKRGFLFLCELGTRRG